MSRSCADDSPKVITRIYNWGKKLVEVSLCKDHIHDPDFQNFVKEFPVQEMKM
ncbi:MAG: hypothetical protein KGI27_13040 [Thaumarchaeota archaeon]|nr:hypothetical protein [Nitrososphaerota archaeon]